MTYSKQEVIELAEQVLGAKLNPNDRHIPLPVLESLGLRREWSKYVEVAALSRAGADPRKRVTDSAEKEKQSK